MPHKPLSLVQELVEAGRVRTTHAARAGAAALGIDFPGMMTVIKTLTPADFYKSMTTHADHRVWQDVYRPNTSFGPI